MFSRFFGSGKKHNAEMHAAALLEDLAGMRQAIEKGANVNALDPLQKKTVLHIAVEKRSKSLVQFLLSKGANPNMLSEQHSTPLLCAIEMGEQALPVVELLLAGRADPSLVCKVGPHAGFDAMSLAASRGVNAILHHLLVFGAKPGQLPNAATLIHLASIGGNAETVELALEAGASVDDVDGDGATALHYGVLHGNTSAVAALLNHGANTQIRNLQGQTAFECAAAGKKKSILKLFYKEENPIVQVTESAPTISDSTGSPEQKERIRAMTLLEFANAHFPDVRFRNVMTGCVTENNLPFQTVGEYLDAGEAGKTKMLRLSNIGLGSVSRLDKAIWNAIQKSAPTPLVEPTAQKRQDLIEQLESRYPGVFTKLLNAYNDAPLADRNTCNDLETNILRILNDARLGAVAERRFRGETLAEIARSLELSRERVRQIESLAKPWMTEQEEKPQPIEEANLLAVPHGIKRAWFEMYLRLKEHHAIHGNANVPHKWSEDQKLAGWVSHQRQQHKKDDLSSEQIQLLNTLEFSWSLRDRGTWDDRLQELIEFKNSHGHFDVPASYSAAPKLRQFIASTRYQYKTGSLDIDRILRLEDAGFNLEPDARDDIKPAQEFTPQAIDSNFTISGRTMTITGRLETLTQGEATQLAKKKGAVVVDKFSGNVDLLLVGIDPGSKLSDAQRSGTTLIDEKQFLNIVR
jgi:ankyrin repeat protein